MVTPWLVRGSLLAGTEESSSATAATKQNAGPAKNVHFGQPFLARFAGRSLWLSCFRGVPGDRLDPPLPFADGPATRTILQSVKSANPHDTWGTFKELVRLGCSESAADNLMLQAAKEGIRENPGKFFASRCRRFIWYWLTPNETFRPNTGDFRFGIERPKLDNGKVAAKADEGLEVEGQSTWHARWYFRQGRLNLLWHPHPAIYALVVLACAASIVVLAMTPKSRGLALFFVLWLGYFSAVTTLFSSPAYRYRMILEPAMIVLVVTGCGVIREKWACKRSKHAV
jgi:hypothetical protein